MSIIRIHTITLTDGNGLVLRPVSDADIPLLCRLNSDMEVLKWSDGAATEPYDEETVRGIWRYVSQNAHCFIVEVDGVPVGDCWLQKMNVPEVLAMYPDGTDVRRIDISIGDRRYWGCGIGTRFVGLLLEFAFREECVDVMHCMCDDGNVRSKRIWEKHGFRLVKRELGAEYEDHWQLTRREYEERKNSGIF